MAIYQRLYWEPRSLAEAEVVLANFRSTAEEFGGDGIYLCDATCDLLFSSKKLLVEQKLPEYMRMADLECVACSLDKQVIDEGVELVKKFLDNGIVDPERGHGGISMTFGWTEHDAEYLDSIGKYHEILLYWRYLQNAGEMPSCCIVINPGYTFSDPKLYLEILERWMAYFDYKILEHTEKISDYYGNYTHYHYFTFGADGSSGCQTKWMYGVNREGVWTAGGGGPSFLVPVDDMFSLVEKVFEFAKVESTGTSNHALIIRPYCMTDFNVSRNYVDYISKARHWLPENWQHYMLGGIYHLRGFQDLEFCREAIQKRNTHSSYSKSYAELDFGHFEHTNDLDDHEDLRVQGELKAIVTDDGIGFAIELRVGPLPKCLSRVFGDSLVDVGLGAIPGIKRGGSKGKKKNPPPKKKRAKRRL